MQLRRLKEAEVNNKTVLVRVDFNVSFDSNNKISDTTRIVQSLPTINYLLANDAKVILAAHLGRPGGKPLRKFSFERVVDTISENIDRKVVLLEKYLADKTREKVERIDANNVIILENVRYHPGEEANNREFARQLSKLADIYVNDAFGTAHRAHASTVGIAAFLPAYAGFLLEKEIKMLSQALKVDGDDLCVVIGGAKTPEKIRVIDRLLDTANTLLLGGAVANTFLSTWGIPTGSSLVDYEMIEMARQVIWKASQSQASLRLPEDVVVSNNDLSREPKVLSYKAIPGHVAIVDIGPRTRKRYAASIKNCDTVIWNGPMGIFEDKRFSAGTLDILKAVRKHKGTTIVGGGDTISAITDRSIANRISHISTGGGAMLEFLERGSLPGIEIVRK